MNLGPSQRRKLLLREAQKAESFARRTTYDCIVPECPKPAIQSHSQQRALLQRLAVDGHVYAHRQSLVAGLVKSAPGSVPSMEFGRIGLGAASTFAGFCARHDNSLFSEIEGVRLAPDACVAELLGFRAAAYELHQKRLGLAFYQRFLNDRVRLLIDPTAWSEMSEFVVGLRMHVDIEAPFMIRSYREQLPKASWRWGVVGKSVGLSNTCAFNLWLDAAVDHFSDQAHVIPGGHFSVVPFADETHIVVTWPSTFDEAASNQVVPAFESNERLVEFVNRMVVKYSTDTVYSPSLYEALDNETLRCLARFLGHGVFESVDQPIPQVVSWDNSDLVAIRGSNREPTE